MALEIEEGVKGFDCADGVPLFNNSFGPGRTSPSRLHYKGFLSDTEKVKDKNCTDAYQGNRMGRVYYDNKDIEAVLNCRKFLTYNAGLPVDNEKYSDIAMIIHNNRSGKTCFFQSHIYVEVGGAGDMPSLAEQGAESKWGSPEEYAGQPACERCHNKSPFIISRYVAYAFAELDLLGD